MSEAGDFLAAKRKEFALKVQFRTGLAEEARCLGARVAELDEGCRTMTSKLWAKRRIANTEMVAEKARTERAGHTAQSAHLKGDLHELNGKSNFSERRNNDADSRHSMPSEKCVLSKRQIVNGEVCSGKMEERHACASENVDESINDLFHHATCAPKAV